MSKYCSRDKMRAIKLREWRRRHREQEDHDKDGSRISKDMVIQRLDLARTKIRVEKKDPFTTHPLSFEDFDNIPDIGEIPNKIEPNKE